MIMADNLKKNLEELQALNLLLMQLMILMVFGMFLVFHILLAFTWGGFLALISEVHWVQTSLYYAQSWKFSRFSVGIPFVVVVFLIHQAYIKYREEQAKRPDDIAKEIDVENFKMAHGMDYQFFECPPTLFSPPYRIFRTLYSNCTIFRSMQLILPQ